MKTTWIYKYEGLEHLNGKSIEFGSDVTIGDVVDITENGKEFACEVVEIRGPVRISSPGRRNRAPVVGPRILIVRKRPELDS